MFTLLPIMVTTHTGHAKRTSAELDDDDGKNHDMYLVEDLYDDSKNHGLSLEDAKTRVTKQALVQCDNPSSAWAKKWIEMNRSTSTVPERWAYMRSFQTLHVMWSHWAGV